MKRFINAKENLVKEAIDGLLAARGSRLARLDGYPHIKVVVRGDAPAGKVAIISGGGSGHEPAHAGFVGQGMLTAAVCGEIFASPSVDAVLAAILAVSKDAGCLLIIKNYTGDRLNFGLAAARAKAMGVRVETVVVSDDIALPDAEHPRGLAGTLFVHKIAGHLAEQGGSLAEVARAARGAAEAVASLGLALHTCTLPGNEREPRLSEQQAEMGLGIHGEPGAAKIPMGSATELAEQVAERLLDTIDKEQRYAVLLNNLGGATEMEMSLIAGALLRTPLADSVDLMLGPSPLMTSLDMNGFSVSLLVLNDQRRTALLSQVEPSAWPGAWSVRSKSSLRPVPEAVKKLDTPPSEDAAVKAIVQKCCTHLLSLEASLNALDSKIGDGDTGTTLATGARNVLAKIDALPYAEGDQLFASLSTALTESMGGSSGVLLAILFAAAGEAFGAGNDWGKALSAGLQQMKAYGGGRLGDRTMIDALEPAFLALHDGDMAEAAQAARAGAEQTRGMNTARVGRASYLSADVLSGVIDPGAEAVASLFEALV